MKLLFVLACTTYVDLCAPLPDKILSHPGHPVRLSHCPPATNHTLPSVRDRQQPEREGVMPWYVTVTTSKCDGLTLLVGSNVESVFVVAAAQGCDSSADPHLVLLRSLKDSYRCVCVFLIL